MVLSITMHTRTVPVIRKNSMSEFEKLSPLEKINVQRALSDIRVELDNAIPFTDDTSPEKVKQMVGSFIKSLKGIVPADYEVTAAVGDEPNVIEVTIKGNLPLIISPNFSLGDFSDMQRDDIKDYFHEEVEYPNDIAENPLPLGRLLSYVSSTFLNGFINYVLPIEAAILNRYVPLDWVMDEALEGKTYQEPAGSFKWKSFPSGILKKELIELLTQPNRLASADLGLFDDDIVLLATAKTDPTIYYFFWFDQDVSDCQIGRFHTSDDVEVVREKFDKFVENLSFGHTQLPLHFFSAGWTVF